METITRPVGKDVTNPNRTEVALVQRLLNRHRLPPSPPIKEDGLVGPKTIAAIEEFQRRVVKMARPDGRVDPGRATLLALSAGSVEAFEPYWVRPNDTVASLAQGRGSQCRASDIE